MFETNSLPFLSENTKNILYMHSLCFAWTTNRYAGMKHLLVKKPFLHLHLKSFVTISKKSTELRHYILLHINALRAKWMKKLPSFVCCRRRSARSPSPVDWRLWYKRGIILIVCLTTVCFHICIMRLEHRGTSCLYSCWSFVSLSWSNPRLMPSLNQDLLSNSGHMMSSICGKEFDLPVK